MIKKALGSTPSAPPRLNKIRNPTGIRCLLELTVQAADILLTFEVTTSNSLILLDQERGLV